MFFWLMPAHSHGIRSQTELGVLVGIEARTLPATILANPKAKENRHRDQSVSKLIFNRSPMYMYLSTNTALSESSEKKNREKDISSILVSQHRKT
jgi:hypothetical protein